MNKSLEKFVTFLKSPCAALAKILRRAPCKGFPEDETANEKGIGRCLSVIVCQ